MVKPIRLHEAQQRANDSSRHCPTVVRAVPDRESRPDRTLRLPLDLVGDHVERLIPADAHVAGLAAVLRIALAVGIEVDALHRMQQALVGIDHRLERLGVRIDGLPPSGEKLFPRALMVQLAASLSSKSIGVMRMILPSFT